MYGDFNRQERDYKDAAILDDNPNYKIAVESNDVMYSNFNAGQIWPGIDYIKTSDFRELEQSYAEKVIVDAHSMEEMNRTVWLNGWNNFLE